MTDYVNIPGTTRQPQAVVLLDPSTGNPYSSGCGKTLTNTFAAAQTGINLLAQTPASKATTWTHSATVTGTGAVSATVLVEGSNDNAAWFTLCTLSPTGTTSATDAITGISASLHIRHRCTAITGTGASANVISSGA